MEKTCIKCGEVKSFSEYPEKRNQCKACRAAYAKLLRENNKARYLANARNYREANRDRINARSREIRKANPERNRAACRSYRLANREELNAKKRAYREANKDKVISQERKYSEANRDKRASEAKAYRESNPEKVRSHNRRARAKRVQAYVPRCDYWKQVEGEMEEKRRELQKQTGDSYHIDHIYPISKGGIDHPVNYQILEGKENIRKGARVDDSCPQQAKLGFISRLVLEGGVDINEAIEFAEETYESMCN